MIRKQLYSAATTCGALFVAAALAAIPVEHASGQEAGSAVAAKYVDPELIAVLEQEAGRKVSDYLQSRGRLAAVRVTVTINTTTSRLTADFGPGFRPGIEQEYAETFLHSLATTLRYYAEAVGVKVHDVDFLRGKAVEVLLPRGPCGSGSSEGRSRQCHGAGVIQPRSGPRASSQDWDFQRPVAFGLREDTITPAYGDELQGLLEQRSGLVVSRARTRSLDLHPESSRPWEQMSARYHLKEVLPERADIWNSLPTDTARDREVREDIRARPLYANDLAVGGMISLHTNGNEIATVRGLEVFYHGDKPADRPLAESVLCGMREVIRAQPGYETFPVRDAANEGRHGENRIGTMPSVLVEIAYHSNADDSSALQDPVFRSASMKGVEKGYRLFREGKTCAPLALTKINRVTVPSNGSAETSVHFNGNPQFPVTLSFTPAFCSQPGACQAGEQTISEASESPIQLRLSCQGTGYGMVNWSTVMRDADGVTSAPIEHWQTCSNDG